MSSLQVQIDATAARFVCDNCQWEGQHDQIEESISDPDDRLNAGCITPAGTCPDCNALVYYTDETAPAWTGQGELHKLKAERAAAPDMLAALRLALDHIPERAMVYSNGTFGDRVYIREVVRSAILAAEGHS